jgi:c-di-GMP-binding flagellar brake protein YcgR
MVRAGARLSAYTGDLMDVSLTGALMVLNVEVPLESRHVLRIVVGTQALELDARVVRVKALTHQHPPQWEVAVQFVDVTAEARRTIPAIVAKMTAALEPRPRGPRGSEA